MVLVESCFSCSTSFDDNSFLFILGLWCPLRAAVFFSCDINHFISNSLWLFILFFLQLFQFFMLFFKLFMLFLKSLIILKKYVLECVFKVIFWHKWWWRCSNCGGVGICSDVLAGSGLCFCRGIHNEEYSVCVCYRPPVRRACPSYEVVEFQPRTVTPPVLKT